MRAQLIGLVALASCIRGNAAFRCQTDVDCANGGVGGTCESTGYCSFGDATCPSGTRYGSLSGPYAGQCVATIPADGPPPMLDAPVGSDATISTDGPIGPPTWRTAASMNSAYGVATLSYPATIIDGVGRYMLVMVSISSGDDTKMCDIATPPIATVTFDGIGMTRVDAILGTPCSSAVTRSEMWGLVAPPVGSFDVAITLDDTASFPILSGALGFDGVDPITPVRATTSAAGTGTSSLVMVSSAPGDLVVSSVGQGTSIQAAGAGQDVRILDNLDGNGTLDNLAASTETAIGTSTTASWLFPNSDEWQSLAISLE
jgi:hypothetical protein